MAASEWEACSKQCKPQLTLVQVVDCRRILKWTYTYGYYTFGEHADKGSASKLSVVQLKQMQEFFEFNQARPVSVNCMAPADELRAPVHQPARLTAPIRPQGLTSLDCTLLQGALPLGHSAHCYERQRA